MTYAEIHKGTFFQEITKNIPSSPLNTDQPVMQMKSPRQCTLKEKINVGSTSSTSQEESSTDSNDEEWNLPLRFERSLIKKTETVTLTLPTK